MILFDLIAIFTVRPTLLEGKATHHLERHPKSQDDYHIVADFAFFQLLL